MTTTRSSVPPAPVKEGQKIPGLVKAKLHGKRLGTKPEPDRNREPTLTERKARQPRAGSFSDADPKTTDETDDCEGRCDVWGDANPRLTKEERGEDSNPDYAIDGVPITTAFQD